MDVGFPPSIYGVEEKQKTYIRLNSAFRRGVSLHRIIAASNGQLQRKEVFAALNAHKLGLDRWALIESALCIAEQEHQESRTQKRRRSKAVLLEK